MAVNMVTTVTMLVLDQVYDPAIMTTDQSGCTNGYVGANSAYQVNGLTTIRVGILKIQL